MKITFVRLGKPTDSTVKDAYIALDDSGKRQAIVTVWLTDFVPLVGARQSVYPDKDCDLNGERFGELTQFAIARLDNGLELDGASVEV